MILPFDVAAHLAAGFDDLVLGFNVAFWDGEDTPPFKDQSLPGWAAKFTAPRRGVLGCGHRSSWDRASDTDSRIVREQFV